MPPANFSWQEPVVQEREEVMTPWSMSPSTTAKGASTNNTAIRRSNSKLPTTPSSRAVPDWTLSCDPVSSSDSSPSPNRAMSQRRWKRKSNTPNCFAWFRTINAVVWILVLLCVIYYRSLRQALPVVGPYEETRSEATSTHNSPNLPLQLTTSSSLSEQTNVRRQPIIVPRSNDQFKNNEQQITHIIHTRFMQQQPHLIDLGLARLELFKEFTLKSLAQQSSRNFLWVIRTDPALNASLRDPLIEVLNGFPNHLLIASNENPNVQIQDIVSLDSEFVWSGDFVAAKNYLLPPQRSDGGPRKIFESRIDADDALHEQFVQYIQQEAAPKLPSEPAEWMIWCSSRHMEWQYQSVTQHVDASAGVLLSFKNGACISAGLTVGYTEGVHVRDLPPIKHDKLASRLSSCKKHRSKCLDFIELSATALRARTPTSAGMLNVLLGRKDKVDGRYVKGVKKQEAAQNQLWSVAPSRFGITKDSATALRQYVKDHLVAIATDNLLGQCSHGHSCKDSSKAILQAIIDNPQAFA